MNANAEIFAALRQFEKERGIPASYMIERITQALLAAYKKDKDGYTDNVFVELTENKMCMYAQKEVVEEVVSPSTEITLDAAKKISKKSQLGDLVNVEIKTQKFGRIAAQTAKQVIIQGIREAQRGMMIKEYETKREEIVTATVERIDEESGNVVVDTGTSRATLLRGEQIPGETFTLGQRIKVYISEVKSEMKGPMVTISRAHAGLVKRLFELETPEIADGTIEIKGITREAGSRTKIAVWSADKNVEAVGSCIGPRGSRIANVLNELHGEKIDVILYSEEPTEYIRAALSPATVKRVEIDGEKSCKVFVDADQLSLAIGKEGQNARMAVRLTGYRIDIKVQE